MLQLLLILFQLLRLSLSQSSVEYTVIPDSDPGKQPCQNCLTLQQFASNVSHHLHENTTLIVQSGKHELDVALTVSNVTTFTMYSESGITLQCNQSGKLAFNSIQHVHIENIHLLDCYGSMVVNVEDFTILNTSFTGSFHVTSGTALEIISSTAILSKCLITKYYYGTYRWAVSTIPHRNAVHRTKKWIGGALIITRSNVTIIDGNFTENRAQVGGAICAQNHSVITIINSTFIFNTANSSLYTPDQTAAGGAIYAFSNCSIFVYSSYFQRNEVYYGYRLGGSIGMYQGKLHIIGSALSNSRAQVGAAVYLSESMGVLNRSNITSSNAYYNGGALHSVNSSLNFDNTLLFDNRAANGGGISMRKSIMIIQNSKFICNSADNDGGVIYASMKSALHIKSSQFKNNSAIDGAVMHIDINTQQELQIKKCEFRYNRASSDGGVLHFYSLQTNIEANVKVTCTQSKFISNEAIGDGGVMHCLLHDSKLIIEESGNTFSSNYAGRSGGVMYISGSTLQASNNYIALNTAGIQRSIVSLTNCRVTFSATTFHKNLASAIIAIESEINFFGKMNFTANELEYVDTDGEPKGSAVTSKFSILTFNGKGVFSNNKASSFGGAICSINSIIHVLGETEFLNNRAIKGGGVYLYQSELLCKNQIFFLENHANISGGGIHSLNSFIRLSSRGSLLYMRNRAELGGGIFLTRSSKINIQEIRGQNWERTIRLIHNFAVYGGGIYIDDEANPLSCIVSESSLAGLENECFFQAEIFVAQTRIKYVFFNLNEASESGSDLYGGLFDRCRAPFGQKRSAAQYLKIFSNIKTLSLSVSSQPVRVCFCRNNQPDCEYQPSQRNATKGGEFTLELVAVDQVNNSLAATINALTSSPESRVGLGQQSQQAQNVCTTLTYELYSNRSSEQLILYANGPCQNANLSSRSVLVHFLPCLCPPGFMVSLKSTSICECICHEQLKPYLQGCDSSTLLLVRNSHAWLDVVNRENLTDGRYVVHHHCPYDYCHPPTFLVQINLSVEGGADAQCAFDRSGILCGACKPSFSVALGSSNCLQCSRYWLFLLIPFSLAGIALIVLLLILDMNVSKGTLNSIVFYSNIVIANRALLIPIEKYNFLAMFISWLSLDLGIETCFVDGLDTYIKTWLQFIFPTYIFVLVFAIIIICQYSQKFSNLLRGRNPVATLATLVWLSNAKYFRTILSVVSFTYLTYPNQTPVTLWLLDGNIQYLKGKHIPLFLVSLVILIAAMVYILILLCWQWLLHLPKCKILCWVRNTRLMSLMDAYHAPYKARHRYWPGLLLFVSMVQYFISASNTSGNPAVNLFAVVILTTCLLVYKGIIAGVYKQWPLDVLESTIHFNLILFSSSTLYIMEGGGNQIVLANISLAVIFITFIIIVGYHAIVLLFQDKAPAFLERFSRSWNGQRRDSISDYLDEFDRDSHHLIKYIASKESNESDFESATKNAEDSTY